MFAELYYWLYELLRKVKTNDNPDFNAFIGISFFQMINIATLLIIVNYFWGFDIIKGKTIYVAIILWILITAINFFTIYKRRKEITEKLKNYSPKRKQWGKIILWSYMIVSIFLLFYLQMKFVHKV